VMLPNRRLNGKRPVVYGGAAGLPSYVRIL
jgi:hypothetical protein